MIGVFVSDVCNESATSVFLGFGKSSEIESMYHFYSTEFHEDFLKIRYIPNLVTSFQTIQKNILLLIEILKMSYLHSPEK